MKGFIFFEGSGILFGISFFIELWEFGLFFGVILLLMGLILEIEKCK